MPLCGCWRVSGRSDGSWPCSWPASAERFSTPLEEKMIATASRYISSTAAGLSAALTWQQAEEAGPEICGGKGYNLGRLRRYGFRVPRGGVIPAAWYADVVARVSEEKLAFIRVVPAENIVDPAVTSALQEIRNELEAAVLPAAMVNGLVEY